MNRSNRADWVDNEVQWARSFFAVLRNIFDCSTDGVLAGLAFNALERQFLERSTCEASLATDDVREAVAQRP